MLAHQEEVAKDEDVPALMGDFIAGAFRGEENLDVGIVPLFSTKG